LLEQLPTPPAPLSSARWAVVDAFLADLAKITPLRIAELIAHGYLALVSGYQQWNWYRDLYGVLADYIDHAVRPLDLPPQLAVPLWFAASFLLVSCYRLTADLLRVGPRSLTRRGFVLPVTGLRQTLSRHLPGFF